VALIGFATVFKRILMVCTGNICRSPMAEVLLAPADPLAQELMLTRGLDLTKHRGRQLSVEMVRGADLVLVMEERQQRAVLSLETGARGRVHRLGRMGKFDIPDPYRRGRASFEEALRLVDRGLDELVPVFWRTS